MKKIVLVTSDNVIEFNVNILEYLIFKSIFKKKRYEVIKMDKMDKLKGRKLDLVIVDEYGS